MQIRANGIDIAFEDSGPGTGAPRPVVMLVMGLGMQLVAWPPAMVQALVDAGYRVIRHDNRDIGLSQHFDHLGPPNLLWTMVKYKLRAGIRPPYSLADMAQDALGLLDALQVERAHVVGVSMGGMIAQRMAIAAPQRLLSLTSIMSSSGARGLPEATPAVRRVLMRSPASPALEDIVAHYVQLYRTIGSPAYPIPEADMRQRIEASIRRSFHPVGTMRQMVAIVADTHHRAQALASVRLPALVLHGRADPLVPFACGEDTARRLHGAELVGIDGMGHDLAPGVVERLVPPMLQFLAANRGSAKGAGA
jgi:pimeloyl-ACP methyl ester carboxylesterase